ncbi:hypothetical protein [Bosea sp. PAMC 26642]|uniref:hypothetical protein n=1 Tax=Bosea sp. (strain PAMC 26642) TaxID=1792307 RepID=UPI0007703C41|nr:hypothetical protein [Bosea sp. PAMC 26642]AMJ59498.1 hypothetical protein AXW83_03515 [Bosea sp. PAMC 26642]
MLYLASKFVWFLLAAFAMGVVMGWLARPGPARRWSRALTVLALIWAVVAASTWSQTVNGKVALWLETGLLFVAAYVVGWLLVSLLPAGTATREAAIEAPAVSEAVASVEPAAAPTAVVAPVDAMPKVEGEDDLPGVRPAGIQLARDGKADDLKLIKGVGRQNEGRLHGLGIWHFDQIAAWDAQNIEWVGGYLAFPGRIEREAWVSQAKTLAAGEQTDFARRAKAGLVSSSRDDGTQGQANVVDMATDGLDGERPGNLLETARDGKPDDLELIKGIGPATAADLNRLGIWHFDQLADLREAEIRYVSAFAGFPGRGITEKWSEEADILKHGGETAHSRAVKAERDEAKD